MVQGTSPQQSAIVSIDSFRLSQTVWLEFDRGTFRLPSLRVREVVGSGIGPFDSPHLGSYSLPIDVDGLSLTVFAARRSDSL